MKFLLAPVLVFIAGLLLGHEVVFSAESKNKKNEGPTQWNRIFENDEAASAKKLGPKTGSSGNIGKLYSFNGKLWLIQCVNAKSTIWSSDDGRKWELATDKAPIPARERYSSLVYGNKIWLFGGTGAYAPDEFVWCSDDGIHWKSAANGFKFPPDQFPSNRAELRSTAQAVVFNDKIWIFYLCNGLAILRMTDDGKWERVVPMRPVPNRKPLTKTQSDYLEIAEGLKGPGRIKKPPKREEPFFEDYNLPSDSFSAIVYQNKIWLLNPLEVDQAWVTSDGLHWGPVLKEIPSEDRSGYALTVFGKEICFISSADRGPFSNEVWTSADGVNWICKKHDVPLSDGKNFEVTSHNGKMYLAQLNQRGEEDGRLVEIWASANGVDWELMDDPSAHLDFPPDSAVVFKDRIWILGTSDNPVLGEDRPAGGYCVWKSADGRSWTEVTNDAGFGAESFRLCYSFNDKMFVIGNNCWFSTDGLKWTSHYLSFFDGDGQPIPGNLASNNPMECKGFIFENKMWAYSDGKLWSSENGEDWVLKDEKNSPFTKLTDGSDGPREEFPFVVFNKKILILCGMGSGEFGQLQKDIWSSRDGNKWRQEATTSSMGKLAGHRALALDDELYVIGGNGRNGVWKSKDGINWAKDNLLSPIPLTADFSCLNFENKIWLLGGRRKGKMVNEVWCSP